MSSRDSLYSEDVEYDVTIFARYKTRKRVLVFPPVNSYRRYIIHQLVQERFPDLLRTFSIGQGSARRTVVCYKSDLRSYWEPKSNVPERKASPATKQKNTIREMSVERRQRSPSTSPERKQLQRQAKSTIEIYRPPAARRASNCSQTSGTQIRSTVDSYSSSMRHVRQRRPDRAVYVPRHRRSLESEEKRPQNGKTCTSQATLNVDDASTNNNSKLRDARCGSENMDGSDLQASQSRDTVTTETIEARDQASRASVPKNVISDSEETCSDTESTRDLSAKPKEMKNVSILSVAEKEAVALDDRNENETNDSPMERNGRPVQQDLTSDVLVISDTVEKKSKRAERAPAVLGAVTPLERKVKKIERQKSKPAPPPSPRLKINRDECDWDSLFDDNGDCLDPTLIEELTSAVGEVTIEEPKNDYKAYSKQIEVSSDEFAHVVEIYNFPSEFKTSDLAAAFSSFKNGGFELKWVDDTHCLGVFSSPLVAAEVLASDHPFVKTRPLSEATALSKTKARKSAEFLQPYRNRPETCAALARRLVTGALGVKLATAKQEREHEKNILREAKEKRRLANKQREDVWEGIIPTK
ncbi:Growth inhibition and differentiation-related protein 88-like protein [Ooceraea biroi]|uniref:Growth inhibition and differentiation-related protein 88-like protein n=1 Tax=Ooceraea biroi TaxID=2015173 RepID=A0A026VVG1_OOCBI|nr:Growth inhibition and differentiation-related protein 88-like protein [Ooceraea biroi]